MKTIDWFITNKCHNRCVFCYAPKSKFSEDCQFDKAREICIELEKRKFDLVGLCGGEPLLHKSIKKVVLELSKRDIKVYLYSALNVKNSDIYEIIPMLYGLSLPLDSFSKEKARLLGRSGSMKSVLSILNSEISLPKHIKVGTVVTRKNLDEISTHPKVILYFDPN